MMRILILIIMLLPCSLGMYASAIDSLLSVLDKTIAVSYTHLTLPTNREV